MEVGSYGQRSQTSTIHGVAKSYTWLSNQHTHTHTHTRLFVFNRIMGFPGGASGKDGI